MNIRFLLLLCITTATIGCENKQDEKQTEGKVQQASCTDKEFSDSDTGGVYTGQVISLSEKRPDDTQRYLSLKSANDTIIFRIFLENTGSPTENFLPYKLKPNACITIIYETEVVEIEGIEVNRFYYAKRLVYP